jgi:hypothetical protein
VEDGDDLGILPRPLAEGPRLGGDCVVDGAREDVGDEAGLAQVTTPDSRFIAHGVSVVKCGQQLVNGTGAGSFVAIGRAHRWGI